MSGNRGYFKPGNPYPLRGHPLWSGCLFAHAVGWGMGFDANGPGAGEPLVTPEDVHGTIGSIETSGAPGNYGVGDFGFGLQNGGPSQDEEVMYFDQGNRFFPATGFVSIAMLVRPLVIPAGGTAAGVLDKATSPGSTTSTEYTLGVNGTASTWRFYATPNAGASNQINSVTTLSLDRTDLVVGTYGAALMKIFVNGILEASITPANFGIKDNNQDLGWYQMIGGGGSVKANMLAGMGAVWDREITEQEVSSLYNDPFAMWAPHNDMRGLGRAPAVAGVPRDMLLSY